MVGQFEEIEPQDMFIEKARKKLNGVFLAIAFMGAWLGFVLTIDNWSLIFNPIVDFDGTETIVILYFVSVISGMLYWITKHSLVSSIEFNRTIRDLKNHKKTRDLEN